MLHDVDFLGMIRSVNRSILVNKLKEKIFSVHFFFFEKMHNFVGPTI
jgi:hypothetical protein